MNYLINHEEASQRNKPKGLKRAKGYPNPSPKQAKVR